MPIRRKRKLGSRVLRLNYQGDDVKALKKRLNKLGYELGPCDNHFGYLTQEALKLFQKDYGLRVDGIAGREVFSLLLADKLPVHRRVHIVQAGETVEQIAAAYGVGVEAFREKNKVDPVYPGQNLCFFDREVWAVVNSSGLSKESYFQNTAKITGLFAPIYPGQDYQLPLPKSNPQILQFQLQAADPGIYLHQLLKNRKKRQNLIESLGRAVKPTKGIYLKITDISRVDGVRYYRFLRALRRKLDGKYRLLVAISPELPRWNWLGGVSFRKTADLVDQVVLPIPIPTQSQDWLDKARIEQTVVTLLKDIPCWKILLQIPVYAVQWNTEELGAVEKMSYTEAMHQVYRRGARQRLDENNNTYYQFSINEADYHLRVAHREKVKHLISLVNRWNLAGIVFDALGMEDKRIWKVVTDYFSVARYDGQK